MVEIEAAEAEITWLSHDSCIMSWAKKKIKKKTLDHHHLIYIPHNATQTLNKQRNMKPNQKAAWWHHQVFTRHAFKKKARQILEAAQTEHTFTQNKN